MRTKLIISLLILLSEIFHAEVFAQTRAILSSAEFSKEIAPIRTMMNKEMTSIKFKKDIFQDIRSNKLIESSSGVLYKGKGLNYKMVNNGLLVIQSGQINLIIDSAANIVQINSIDSSLKISNFLADLPADLLNNYQFEKIVNSSFFVLKATAVKTDEGTMEFFFHTKTNMLYKFVLTFPPGNYFSEEIGDETLEIPSVVMVYEPIQILRSGDVSFDYSPYVKLKENGKFELTEKMVGYELIDTRYQPITSKN